jgi:hypothetical protein
VPRDLAMKLHSGVDEMWNRIVASLGCGEGHPAQRHPVRGVNASSSATFERKPGARRSDVADSQPPLIRFIHEAQGRWTVLVPDHDYPDAFSDLRAALDFARRSYGAAAATLWLSVDGLVIVIPQEPGWPRPVIGDAV